MGSLLIVALVCAASLSPDACSRETALDLVVQPATSAIPTECLAEGQFIVAGGSLGASLGPGAYLKLACERRRARAPAGTAHD